MNQLTELRNIIVGEQQEQLENLKQRLEESQIDARKVADVLPDSVRLSMQAGGQLSAELKPFVAKSVMETVESDPSKFAEVLYPVLLPAIKLMIANTIRSFVKTMNRSIESATTAKGIKWRLEALRKGIPYSEVVLRKTLEYRVEHIYLFERDAGVLIEHLINENVQGIDSDAVAGMFTAIQSFVRDSFRASNEENLTQMNVGDLDVWLLHGPLTTLACVIRGNAPYELRDQLDRIHDQIYVDYAPQLKEFDGQIRINGLAELLEPCLQIRLNEFEKKKTASPPLAAYMVIFFCIAALLISGFIEWRKNVIADKVESLLYITPGVLPTRLQWIDKKLHIYGLRESQVDIPWDTLKQLGLSKDQVQLSLKTYQVVSDDQ